MWNAYYNHIAYTTDRFYSGWTGFDTYASFQTDRTVTYQHTLGGLSVGANLVQGGDDAPQADSRFILGASYAFSDAVISFGYDSQGEDGDDSNDLIAVAGEVNFGDLRLAGKHEIAQKGAGRAQDKNGQADTASISSLMAQYTMGANTVTLHYGFGNYLADYNVNNDTTKSEETNEGSEIGIGIAHSLSDSVTLFAEYHTSDDYCAYDIAPNRDADGIAAVGAGVSTGCSVFTTGAHYSF